MAREKKRTGATGVPSGVRGLYGWERDFEEALAAVTAAVSRLGGSDRPHFIRFPPVISRETIDRVRYREAFPHLLGEVAVWDEASETNPSYRSSSLSLAPAACYHVYPSAEAVQDGDGEAFEVESWCFRNEAEEGPARLSSFRMHEFVKIGEPATVHRWRDEWAERALAFSQAVGLDARIAPATDPFFGAGGAMLSARQRSQGAKLELLAPLAPGRTVAVGSFNDHHTHFGEIFELSLRSGEPASTACAAFGLERLTSALILRHGEDLRRWPPFFSNLRQRRDRR